jgi:hypothetical protein
MPSALPTSSPTTICSPGSFHEQGGYVTEEDCKLCPAGTYQPNHAGSSCDSCPGLTWSDEGEENNCRFVKLGAGLEVQVGVVATLVTATVVIFALHSPSKDLLHYVQMVLFSTCDTNSDLLYVMTSVFYSKYIFGFSLIFLFLPASLFCYLTYSRMKALIVEENGGVLSVIGPRFPFVAISMPSGYPRFHGRSVFPFENIDGQLARGVWYFIALLICVFGQILSSILWVVFHVVFYPLLFVFGYWMHVNQLSQNTKIRKRWFSLLLTEDAYIRFVKLIPPDEEIDVEGANNAVVGEVFLESIPQAGLVLFNGYLMKELTTYDYICVSGGALVILNCLYKYAYWWWWMGVGLKNIPLSGRPHDKHVSHSSFKLRVDEFFDSPPANYNKTSVKDDGKAAPATATGQAISTTGIELTLPSDSSHSLKKLTLKECIDIIRTQLHIEETAFGNVVRIALEELNDAELTRRCECQSGVLKKTHFIIVEGLGMSLFEDEYNV